MRKGYRRLIDWTLVLLGLAVVIVLLQAPPATTPELPVDDIHRPLLSQAVEQGKKSAEARCQRCHNPADIPFVLDHPSGRRCLFCHRLPAQMPGPTAPGS